MRQVTGVASAGAAWPPEVTTPLTSAAPSAGTPPAALNPWEPTINSFTQDVSTLIVKGFCSPQIFLFPEKEFNLGKSSILSEPMFCVCGFSAHSGNKMAKHLGTHGCKSAYPSQEEADKAKVEKVEKGEKRKDRQEEADSSSQMEEDGDIQKEDGTDVEKVGDDDQQENNDKEDKSKKDEATTEGEESGEVGKENESNESESEASIEKEIVEKNTEERKTDSPDTDENEKEAEAEKPPGPGGLLFGTFFNYMGADQSSGDKANNEKKSEDVVSEGKADKCKEDEKETNDEIMETE